MEEIRHGEEIYRELTDEALIQRLRDGETSVTDFLMNKYKNLVRKKAGTMFILGADKEDLIQEGMIGLFKAVREYDSGRDASFYTFADLCISRQMYSAVQASSRKKHIPLNTYVSIFARTDDKDANGRQLEDVLYDASAKAVSDPEALMIDKENVKRLENTIDSELSAFEKEVLSLYMTGMTYTEIAKVLNREEKATDNALQRTKKKLKKALNLTKE
ncbi:MAG: RNA polymerase sporulation sigma factor SigH [Lachnospiraceae bacterium]|nr:RNA polymerase sporulation sigma factor SigH [Lachnospiraceae bacterium]